LGSTYSLVQENTGYFNTLLRMLIRATADDIGNIISAGAGFIGSIAGSAGFLDSLDTIGPLDVNKQIGLDADPTNILNAVSSLRDSKLMRFMDIVATIGDIALMIEGDELKRFESSIDSVNEDQEPMKNGQKYPNPAALVKKSRLSDKAGPGYLGSMAWGNDTIRSLYLLPAEYGHAEKMYTGVQNAYSVLAANKNTQTQEGGRLKKEHVQLIEQELDACYMPFYFHDLRTNEIIAFHAFIENVTDSFDAEYAESDGYGRVGKVYTYKNTNRTITCSFRVVSTNKRDFGEMWHKINKLLMLIYPQYTAGRLIKHEEGDFYQPFSQLISNSPMIRLRLGDLLKTNYSKFDLARLFGIGSKNFTIGGAEPMEPLSQEQIDKMTSAMVKIINTQKNLNFDEGDTFFLNLSSPTAGSRDAVNKILKYKNSNEAPRISTFSKVLIKKQIGSSGNRYEIEITPKPVSDKGTIIADFGQSNYIDIELDYPNIFNKAYNSTGLGGVPGATGNSTFSENAAFDDSDNVINENLQNFLDSEKNPIFRSFESTSGQGLAGFIRRISFDWSDANWDTEGLNHRAPMWCKIDIDFAPVHDLNPGIDSTGAMIAPPYNIGALMQIMKSHKEIARQMEQVIDLAKKKAAAATPNREGEAKNDLTSGLKNLVPI